MSRFIAFFVLLFPVASFAQLAQAPVTVLRIDKVEPPNWWVGMKWNRLQLMVYGSGLNDAEFAIEPNRIRIDRVDIRKNQNYAFLNLTIPSDLPPGDYKIKVQRQHETAEIHFPIHSRESSENRHQGFGQKDIIYLLTPDRFANADQSNDHVTLRDLKLGFEDDFDPAQASKRHGGDLQGVIDHLDYLAELGVTTLWLNPILENRGRGSYHGYAATDLYRVDPRFGSNELYRDFVQQAHRRGLKVIFDHISNHIGVKHPWIENLPAENWLNGSVENHLSDKHYMLSILDPHADPNATEMLKTFWFVDAMPDLNQKNDHVANYIIQNTIWWIESCGLDGIREDTYPYNDQRFMTRWAKAVFDEYPKLNVVGEIWTGQPAFLAQFQDSSSLPRKIETHLPSIMDFALMDGWRGFLEGKARLREIHQIYAQDFLYSDPSNLVVFLDNHDISRAILHANGDSKRVKLACTVLVSARGIPQFLYGTEIGMLGGESHVELRANFPGGFPGDTANAFTEAGRDSEQNEMFNFFRNLFQIRKQHPALSEGKMIHYAPTWNNDTYVILKIHDTGKILVIANGNEEAADVDLSELERHLRKSTKLKDLQTGTESDWKKGTKVPVPAMTAKLFLLVE